MKKLSVLLATILLAGLFTTANAGAGSDTGCEWMDGNYGSAPAGGGHGYGSTFERGDRLTVRTHSVYGEDVTFELRVNNVAYAVEDAPGVISYTVRHDGWVDFDVDIHSSDPDAWASHTWTCEPAQYTDTLVSPEAPDAGLRQPIGQLTGLMLAR